MTILLENIKKLKGVGEVTLEAFSRLKIERVIDLLFHIPVSIVKKTRNPNLYALNSPAHVILDLEVISYSDPASFKKGRRNGTFKIETLYQGKIKVSIMYFNYFPSYILPQLEKENQIIVCGKLEKFIGHYQIAHPTQLVLKSKEKIYNIETIEAIYPLTYAITSKQIAKFVSSTLQIFPNLPEWIHETLINKYNFPSFEEAIKALHNPKSEQDLAIEKNINIKRLAFDEIFASQLVLNLLRCNKNKDLGREVNFLGEYKNQLLELLPFRLTDAQNTAIKEIEEDQRKKFKMMRLLQGDVGSGKTIVALIAMLNSIEAGLQACIMVPLDILANQHYESMKKYTDQIGIKIALLTGKITGKKRQQLLEDLQNGEIDIVVGTHALFTDHVKFKELGLIIIDEQHRFGVNQRLSLAAKNEMADILVMTATPIPRTLALSLYGDMDISKIEAKPAGRKEIKTSSVSGNRIDDVISSLHRITEAGGRVYWICPLIEEKEEDQDKDDNDRLSMTAAVSRFEDLQRIFGDRVGIVHGKMKSAEKDQIIEDFASGKITILVATTVIEVGINVPEASLIVIEHAERFGLAQLHQLRGRVGRSDIQSYCILLYYYPISEIAKERIKVMKETNDGFLIAERDLELRGSGDLIGTKQSGLAEFKFADLVIHRELFDEARTYAKEIIIKDPNLSSIEGQKIKELLLLFGYEDVNSLILS